MVITGYFENCQKEFIASGNFRNFQNFHQTQIKIHYQHYLSAMHFFKLRGTKYKKILGASPRTPLTQGVRLRAGGYAPPDPAPQSPCVHLSHSKVLSREFSETQIEPLILVCSTPDRGGPETPNLSSG